MRVKVLDTQEVDECIDSDLKNVTIIRAVAHRHLVYPGAVYFIGF